MQETLVRFLGWEGPLEKGNATHSSILGASVVAQLVKNLSARRETWVPSLRWEDPPEKGKATHSSILAMENPTACIAHGVSKSWTRLSNVQFFMFLWHADIIRKALRKTYAKKQHRDPGFLQNPGVVHQWKLSQHRFPKSHLW